jgi:hypothetical protein
MTKIKILNNIEGTDLVRVEIDHVIQIKSKSSIEKMCNESKVETKTEIDSDVVIKEEDGNTKIYLKNMFVGRIVIGAEKYVELWNSIFTDKDRKCLGIDNCLLESLSKLNLGDIKLLQHFSDGDYRKKYTAECQLKDYVSGEKGFKPSSNAKNIKQNQTLMSILDLKIVELKK